MYTYVERNAHLPLLGCDEDHLAGGCIGDGLCAFEAENVSSSLSATQSGTQWVQVAIGTTSALHHK